MLIVHVHQSVTILPRMHVQGAKQLVLSSLCVVIHIKITRSRDLGIIRIVQMLNGKKPTLFASKGHKCYKLCFIGHAF